MAIRSSGTSGIPFGGTTGRPANPGNGQPYFNGDIGRLELYTSGTGWQNIVQETPGVASVSGHYYESDNFGTFTVSGTNFVSGAIAYAIGTNGIEYQASTTTYNSLVQLTVTFSNLSAAYEPYDVKVTNPSNLFGLLPDAFYINQAPIWSTASGSLGTFPQGAVSVQLSATDAESNSLTYSLISGSLPTGLSVSSTGLISGTNTANPGTYSFVISASDGYNTAVNRSLSMIVPYPTVTGGTLTSDSTYYYRTFTSSGTLGVSGSTLSADILLMAGGGGTGTNGPGSGAGAGAGAGGALASSSIATLPTGNTSITVGGGGAGTNNNTNSIQTPASNGTNSSIVISGSTYSAIGGGAGGGAGQWAKSGGCGGGGNSSPYSTSTQTSYTGFTGYGNPGSQSSTGTTGGGGGGIGAAAGNSPNGGSGLNTWSSWAPISALGTSGYIGGGGGGYNAGSGGLGGGGAMNMGNSSVNNGNGYSGTAYTGGGGGGTINGDGSTFYGGSGGSGIVVLRYTKASIGG